MRRASNRVDGIFVKVNKEEFISLARFCIYQQGRHLNVIAARRQDACKGIPDPAAGRRDRSSIVWANLVTHWLRDHLPIMQVLKKSTKTKKKKKKKRKKQIKTRNNVKNEISLESFSKTYFFETFSGIPYRQI